MKAKLFNITIFLFIVLSTQELYKWSVKWLVKALYFYQRGDNLLRFHGAITVSISNDSWLHNLQASLKFVVFLLQIDDDGIQKLHLT